MRILFYDVETAPMLSYLWQLRADYVNPNFVTNESYMISWAAKWADQKQIKSDVLEPFEAQDQDDSRIVESLADLIREADVVVAHNGDSFDIKVVNARVIANGLEPLGPVKTIDTKTLAKKSFRFASNSLDFIAHTVLGLEGKIKTDFDLWKRCYQGDYGALREMVRYNRQDVKVLEQVFEAMRPYVKGLPRLHEAEYDGEMACTNCGSHNLHKRGFHRTNVSTFQTYQCQDCSRYSRSRVSERKRLGVTTTP